MFLTYLKRRTLQALRGSIDSALSWSGIIGIGIMGGISKAIGKEMRLADDWQSVVSVGIESAIVAWIIIFTFRFIFIAPYSLWKASQTRVMELEQKEYPVTSFEPPSIIIGQGSPYEKTTSYANERLNRTLLVGVKNNRPSSFLSNCKLYLEHRWSNGKLEKILLADTFDLPPKGERYVQVAYYNESANPDNRDTSIHLCMPYWGGAFSYEHMPSADKKHIVTLELEAHENIALRVDCYLWVDDNGRLKLEQV